MTGMEITHQWADLFGDWHEGINRVAAAITREREKSDHEESQTKPPPTPASPLPFEPELAYIPAGLFLMGSSDDDLGAYDDEKPQHAVHLEAYHIGRFPVTNAQYAAFVTATGHSPPDHWDEGRIPPGLEDHPAVCVSWYDAQFYVAWLRERSGRPYRLPTEAEWEKAARGTDARNWPWGDDWDHEKCNSAESGLEHTTPVGRYSPAGDSPYGCADMAGNVQEWTQTVYELYGYDPKDGRENLQAEAVARVLRGGAFGDCVWAVRCAYRRGGFPGDWYKFIGFRVVVSSSNL